MSTEAPDGLDCLGCGNEFSASISLTISGGKHCDDDCKAKGEYCYAEAIEHQYPLLAAKMKRRQANQARALNQATLAVRRIRNYFIRIAKLGTLLNPADALRSPGYMDALKLFVIENYKADNDLQIFLESPKKVRFYRAWFRRWGVPFVIRESLQSLASVQRRKAGQQTSYIVGEELSRLPRSNCGGSRSRDGLNGRRVRRLLSAARSERQATKDPNANAETARLAARSRLI